MSMIITGSSGCIGRALLKKLAPPKEKIYALYNKSADFEAFLRDKGLGKNVIPKKCDLTNPKEVEKLFREKNSFDQCVFLAANINVAKSIENPALDLDINAGGLINFLKAARVKRLIYMSSTSVYDGLVGKVGPGSNLRPLVPYGISKLTAEYYVKFFAKKIKSVSEYAILRLSGAYGPYSPAKKIYNRIIKDFYFDKKNEITLFGDGKNFIDLLHVDEISRAVILALKSKRHDYTLDICSGNPMRLNDLIRLGADIFRIKNLRIRHAAFPETEKYMTYEVSPEPARRILGFINKINYEEGLTDLARFYEKEGF